MPDKHIAINVPIKIEGPNEMVSFLFFLFVINRIIEIKKQVSNEKKTEFTAPHNP